MQLDDKTNVASFNSSPGFTKFQAFCAEYGEDDKDNPVIFSTMVSDDEESVHSTQEGEKFLNISKSRDNTTQDLVESPGQADFNLEGPTDMEIPTVV